MKRDSSKTFRFYSQHNHFADSTKERLCWNFFKDKALLKEPNILIDGLANYGIHISILLECLFLRAVDYYCDVFVRDLRNETSAKKKNNSLRKIVFV